MQARRIRTNLCSLLLLGTWVAGPALAADAAHIDITPEGGSYGTRTNQPGNRSTDASGVAASFAFQRLDTNRNLTISRSEAEGSDALAAQFSQVDSNHDFQITPSEFRAFEIQQMRAQQKPGSAPSDQGTDARHAQGTEPAQSSSGDPGPAGAKAESN